MVRKKEREREHKSERCNKLMKQGRGGTKRETANKAEKIERKHKEKRRER